MNNFNNNQKSQGKCNLCGSNFISGQFGAYCPNYKEHKAKGEKPYALFADTITKEKVPFDSFDKADFERKEAKENK